MTELNAQVLRQHPEWRLVLEAYRRLQEQQPSRAVETDEGTSREKWFARLTHIDGVPDEKLAVIHGKLIALGWLQFQLRNGDEGVVYRVSPEGRWALDSFDGQQARSDAVPSGLPTELNGAGEDAELTESKVGRVEPPCPLAESA